MWGGSVGRGGGDAWTRWLQKGRDSQGSRPFPLPGTRRFGGARRLGSKSRSKTKRKSAVRLPTFRPPAPRPLTPSRSRSRFSPAYRDGAAKRAITAG